MKCRKSLRSSAAAGLLTCIDLSLYLMRAVPFFAVVICRKLRERMAYTSSNTTRVQTVYSSR